MLKEFIEAVAGLSVKAAGPHKLASVDPRVEQYVLPTGERLDLNVAPPLRNYTAMDLGTIVRLRLDAADDASPEIWVGNDRVTLVLDRDDRRERAVYMLRFSDRFRSLMERLVTDGAAFTQAALVQFLRLKLGLSETVVGRFRALQWSSGDDANATVQRGVDKLGASIRREVINAADVPEELHVTLSVLDGLVESEFQRTITLLVELDAAQRMIRLVPRPGDVTLAVDSTLIEIQLHLSEATGEDYIYRGAPG
jgi:hypothetical protein